MASAPEHGRHGADAGVLPAGQHDAGQRRQHQGQPERGVHGRPDRAVRDDPGQAGDRACDYVAGGGAGMPVGQGVVQVHRHAQ
jgi:hypothetical protein